MAGAFTVKILSSEDFEKLPFVQARENPSMVFGAADPARKIAFVRDTGFNDFTKATIEHELDELMAQQSPHEIDGIRFKDFSQAFSSFGSSLPVIGKVAGPVLGAFGQVPDLLGAGISSVGRGIKNILTPGPAAPRPGPGSTRVGIPTPEGALTATFPGVGQGPVPRTTTGSQPRISAPSIFDSFKRGILGQGIGPGTVSGIADIGNFAAGSKFPGTAGGPPITSGGVPTPDIQPIQTEGDFLSTVFNNLGKKAPGLLISGLGQLLAPKPGDIDVSGITGPLRGRITGEGPVSELFSEGQAQLLQDLRDPTEAPPESAFIRGDQIIQEDLENQIKQLRDQFKALNPTANVENNSAFLREKSRLEERARERRAAVRDEISFQFTREQLQRDLQEIQLALNLDSAQTEQLIRLAQLDAEALAINYNLSLRESQEFKDIFSGFGDLIFRPEPEATAPTEPNVRRV